MAEDETEMSEQRWRICINGQVQGVGFRPHVYKTACGLGLTGWVRNHAEGVLMEVQGGAAAVFLPRLIHALPPLARVDQVRSELIPCEQNEAGFQIVPSQPGRVNTVISPDAGICDACLAELFEPQSRFYLYPFLNCTHCGPRLTITRQLPYDRCQTSMNEFTMCQACQRNYTDPEDRRYHAQPIACPQCGPKLSESAGRIAMALMQGQIIALKGLGGYQFLCDARNPLSVMALRARKQRPAKPFALMTLNSLSAARLADISLPAKKLLESTARPIVLLPRLQCGRREMERGESVCPDQKYLDLIAPGLSTVGMMLPGTPLHYLVFHAMAGFPSDQDWLEKSHPGVLVVTSANENGEPIIADDDEARQKLESAADGIISYNREIVSRADDSVVRVINHAPVFIRRARGYVPVSVKLPHAIPATLALGGHLKNTFCLTRGDEAFVSQHIGTLNNPKTIDFFHETIEHFSALLAIKPERIAHDLHPDFYTTRFAQTSGLPCYAIQHHHAHLAAVVAEKHIPLPALGLAMDGYGYGDGGEIWGGEMFLLRNDSSVRLGGFTPLPLPGGDIAAREPWRMAASVLHVLGRGSEIPVRFVAYPLAAQLCLLLDGGMAVPQTSSCGRLFDAASGILGVTSVSQYEGQAAMRLESLVTRPEIWMEGWHIENGCLNLLPLLGRLFDMDPVRGANLFHGTLAAALAEWVMKAAETLSLDMVILSGGCFINKTLSEALIRRLADNGLNAVLPRMVPLNDGGLSLGQAWVAGRQ